MSEAIMELYKEGMKPQQIALKLGIAIDAVLQVVFGKADDWRDKRRYALGEERGYMTT